ncbi:uncharacterized protein ACWYII_018819 isoform 2-T5 [Salvelinus alpinus]
MVKVLNGASCGKSSFWALEFSIYRYDFTRPHFGGEGSSSTRASGATGDSGQSRNLQSNLGGRAILEEQQDCDSEAQTALPKKRTTKKIENQQIQCRVQMSPA